MSPFQAVFRLIYICKDLLSEVLTFIPMMAWSQASSAAEILFLRKQLAFYQEQDQATPIRRWCTAVAAALLEVFRLEEGTH
jgi:hypothetical protein